MKIEILLIGKTTEAWLKEGIGLYMDRLKNYIPVNMTVLPASSSKLPNKMIVEESESITSKFQPRDFIILLDERGKNLRSIELASQIEKWMIQGVNRVVFIIGGAYGVSDDIKRQAHLQLAVSKLTFTHQMVRLILVEQLYRAMSIIRNESYHHE